MTSTEETKYIVLPTVAVAIIAALMFSGSGTPSNSTTSTNSAKVVTSKEDKKSEATKPVETQVEITPEQKAQKEFESARRTYGYLLTQLIKKSSFDEDALKLKRPEYYKNGVCVQANGKNRFGAYVGWQEYCYLYKDGKWDYSGPN